MQTFVIFSDGKIYSGRKSKIEINGLVLVNLTNSRSHTSTIFILNRNTFLTVFMHV